MKANWDENLPPAGILDHEDVETRRYLGMNPAFVRQVWAKRRKQAERVPRGPAPKWTEEEKARVASMMQAGLTSGQIAMRMGKTPASICGLVHSHPELKAIGFKSVYAEKYRSAHSAPLQPIEEQRT